MKRVIGWIEHMAVLGACVIAAWTAMEIVKAFVGWWPSLIFAGCIAILCALPSKKGGDT